MENKVKISNKVFIIILIYLLTSCDTKIPNGFYIEKKYKNGNIKILTKNLEDTLINNTKRNLKFSKIFALNGNLIEEGKFIDNKKIGTHLIYEKGKLKYIKSYYFISDKDDIFFSDIKIFGDSVVNSNKQISYLNSKIAIDTNQDTIFERSSFVDLEFQNKYIKLGDSLTVNITYYDADSHIESMRIFIFAPDNDDLFDFLFVLGNNCIYKSKTILKGKNILKGFAIINVFDIKNSTDTVYGYKVYKINKEYFVY